MLIDTHCHIHEVDYPLAIDDTLSRAHDNDVNQLICVGTNIDSSMRALQFSSTYSEVYASIGVHPHDTNRGWTALTGLVGADTQKLVAVGEIGLDYFYTHSPREVQIQALEWQIDFALNRNLPIIFHVRDAFDDFWPIFNNFQSAGRAIRGELHSFTDNQQNLDIALGHGLLIGVNGISTFTRDEAQQATFASIPLSHLLLETDAPFLTPVPFRGKINEPAFVKHVAEHHARIRSISFEEVATATTTNARALFAF